MADESFRDPRLAAIHDALDPDRGDLDVYAGLAAETGARRVLDIGCGTGVFALLLAERGIEVTGVDPARASVDVARAKPGGERVRWICADATALPPMHVDLVTMTANVAQAITGPQAWLGTLRGAYGALRPGGLLVFETRDPAARAWERWHRGATYRVTAVPGVGSVESWAEVTEVDGPLVTFRETRVFAAEGRVLTSESTLRFREREEVEADLTACGFVLEEVRGAPDRPGLQLVFLARRPPTAHTAHTAVNKETRFRSTARVGRMPVCRPKSAG
ncbi:class I SAM-dependent methyltransferase [Streptomyces sp. NPDC048603]|uniref:class I SAM-dependent methyltransferase n=1 Tax=Streptomyces sp. NPDC048603 TaxID=3365577 RepID=UPI0037239692